MNKNYLDNKRFEEVIALYCLFPEYPETEEEIKKKKLIEDELVEMLDILISNILMTFKFYIDYDDAKQECYLLIFKILKNFNKDQGSAFNYFTTVIVNNMKFLYTKDKKYRQKIAKYQETLLPPPPSL